MHVQATIVGGEEHMSKLTDALILSLRLRAHFPFPLDKDIDVYKQIRVQRLTSSWSPANLLYERLIGVLGEPDKDYSSWVGQKLGIELDYVEFNGSAVLRVINIQLPEYVPLLTPIGPRSHTSTPARVNSRIVSVLNKLRHLRV